METMKAIAKRKSTRSYKLDQIPDDILDTILAAGCAAPVGLGKYNTLHITVVQDEELLKRISVGIAKLMNVNHDPIYAVPTLVLISSQEALPVYGRPVPGVEYANASCVIENMLIAATDQNIGSVILWGTAFAVNTDEALQKALAIPDGFKPIASVGLGYGTAFEQTEKELKITVAMNRV